MYNLFTKTLYDKRWFILGWCAGIAFLSFVIMSFYPSFHQDNGLGELLKSLPPALKGLVGNLGDLKQVATYLGSQLFEIRIPIFVSILSILLATSLTIGEEDKGQLRSLLALPLSRGQIIAEKWLAIVVITFITTAGSLCGIYLGLLIIHESVDAVIIVELVGFTWLLCVALTTVVFAIGMASGRRTITLALAVVVAIGSFLLTTFAKAVDWLQPYEKFSLLHYFPANEVAHGNVNWTNGVVLIVVIVISLLVAWVCFRQRDVK